MQYDFEKIQLLLGHPVQTVLEGPSPIHNASFDTFGAKIGCLFTTKFVFKAHCMNQFLLQRCQKKCFELGYGIL